jgi:hypothetical protein
MGLKWGYSMNEIVDRIMNSSEIKVFPDSHNRAEIRARVDNYIATLSSAGKDDVDQLIEYGLAYLRDLREGPDPRYTGC